MHAWRAGSHAVYNIQRERQEVVRRWGKLCNHDSHEIARRVPIFVCIAPRKRSCRLIAACDTNNGMNKYNRGKYHVYREFVTANMAVFVKQAREGEGDVDTAGKGDVQSCSGNTTRHRVQCSVQSLGHVSGRTSFLFWLHCSRLGVLCLPTSD